jgi:hypothetical protein
MSFRLLLFHQTLPYPPKPFQKKRSSVFPAQVYFRNISSHLMLEREGGGGSEREREKKRKGEKIERER